MRLQNPFLLALLLFTGCQQPLSQVDSTEINKKLSNSLVDLSCRTEQGSSYIVCTFKRTKAFDAIMRRKGPNALGTKPRTILEMHQFRKQRPLDLSNALSYGCTADDLAQPEDAPIAVYPRVLLKLSESAQADRRPLLFEAAIGPSRGCIVLIDALP